ncbi:MAG: crossover junction endodeoxyribonuclease RuvC [Betaproteobacteria bacterium]|nr:crossover junction endodeoxyribonuclease RuvC [Betaproteobacteria bacterium]
MKILGIDPGLRITGFGVVHAEAGKLRYGTSGIIRVPTEGALPQRLKYIYDHVREVVQHTAPDMAVCEIVFVNANPQATLLLGQARGAAITALVSQGLEVHEYSNLQLKQAVVGYGKAKKEQVQEMVMRLLQLPGKPSPDAADALGLAICHAHSMKSRAQLQAVSDKLGALGGQLGKKGLRVKRGRLV